MMPLLVLLQVVCLAPAVDLLHRPGREVGKFLHQLTRKLHHASSGQRHNTGHKIPDVTETHQM